MTAAITGQYRDKRTWDNRIFDFDCSDLLGGAEVITSVTSITADFGGISFGTPTINPAPISYPLYGRTPGIGKVVQAAISGGVIPAGADFLMIPIRLRLVTNLNPQLEATVWLRLIDTP